MNPGRTCGKGTGREWGSGLAVPRLHATLGGHGEGGLHPDAFPRPRPTGAHAVAGMQPHDDSPSQHLTESELKACILAKP